MPHLSKITQIYAILISIGGLCGMLYKVVDVTRTLEQLVEDHEELKEWVLLNETKNELARTSIAVVLDRNVR